MRLTCLASLTLMATALAAAEPAGPAVLSRGDMRLLAGVLPAYEVEEESTASATGSVSSYDWKDTDSNAGAIGVQYLREFGPAERNGQALIGVELLIHTATLTPGGYTSGGQSFGNADGEEFSYVGLSPALVLGWRFAQPTGNSLGFLGELQAAGGVTALSGTIDNGLGNESGYGFGLDGAVRGLLGLQEAGWTGTVSVGLRSSWATISLDQTTKSSDLTLNGLGAEILVSAGWLF